MDSEKEVADEYEAVDDVVDSGLKLFPGIFGSDKLNCLEDEEEIDEASTIPCLYGFPNMQNSAQSIMSEYMFEYR